MCTFKAREISSCHVGHKGVNETESLCSPTLRCWKGNECFSVLSDVKLSKWAFGGVFVEVYFNLKASQLQWSRQEMA